MKNLLVFNMKNPLEKKQENNNLQAANSSNPPENSRKKKVWYLLGCVFVIGSIFMGITQLFPAEGKEEIQTARVQKGNIAVTVTGSGTLEPLEYYEIVPLVKGEILSDYITEGQQVQKGDILYQIDTADMENTVARNQLSVQKAQISYSEAAKSVADLQVKAEGSGTVTNLLVKEGDTVQNGTQIAEITNADQGLVKVSFLPSAADTFYVGQEANILLQGSFANLSGTVSRISSGQRILEDFAAVKDIEIIIDNPGNIAEGQECIVTIGDLSTPYTGIYYPSEKKYITAKTSGDIQELKIGTGDKVSQGDIVAVLTSNTVENNRKNSNISLQESKLSLASTQDQLEDYKITAPISGTVIQKNSKAGDTLDSSDKTVMAVVADMSKMVFTIDVDELDISQISVGQTVTVTADAQPDKTYSGIVENISLIGTSSNGVTSYPVEVSIQDYDGLLPGMNVDASIVVETQENVLMIPSAALYRGNWVAVQGTAPADRNNETNQEDTDRQPGKRRQASAPTNIPNGFYAIQVETGISNDDYIEIISGLEADDVVYLNQTTTNKQNSQNMMGGMPGGMGAMGGGMPSGNGGPPSGGGMGGGGGASGGRP
ncbi:MAG: HlyD family efflux transporter periplasmic adaptor subunit [Peptococcaceae bacterium]|nr:HlyD family efflux transporter periplasmic adaptor subunit [Peptococcaceae bacterium]